MAKALTSRSEDYAQWYNDLVKKADLAENSAVRGCMVIKSTGVVDLSDRGFEALEVGTKHL